MSNNENGAAFEVCASCGKAEVDDVKLKKCACDLVKYCGVDCQKNHRPQHKELCKKRLAELRDKDLFTQPDSSNLGECPICFFPLPLDQSKSTMTECCSKIICKGCEYENEKLIIQSAFRNAKCLFCREPVANSPGEARQLTMKRIKKNDPAAMSKLGRKLCNQGDYKTALEYLTKAAKLGDADAHFGLSIMYHQGQGVKKDMKKQVHHLEEAAIGGHPSARHNLGCIESGINRRFERARKHFIIAANLGNEDSLKMVKHLHTMGHASKEDYADALRAYQTAVEATKSTQREEAEAYYKARNSGCAQS